MFNQGVRESASSISESCDDETVLLLVGKERDLWYVSSQLLVALRKGSQNGLSQTAAEDVVIMETSNLNGLKLLLRHLQHDRVSPISKDTTQLLEHDKFEDGIAVETFIYAYIEAVRFQLGSVQSQYVQNICQFYTRNLVHPEVISMLGEHDCRHTQLYQVLMEEFAYGVRAGKYNVETVDIFFSPDEIEKRYQNSISHWDNKDIIALLGHIGTAGKKSKRRIISIANGLEHRDFIQSTKLPPKDIFVPQSTFPTTPLKRKASRTFDEGFVRDSQDVRVTPQPEIIENDHSSDGDGGSPLSTRKHIQNATTPSIRIRTTRQGAEALKCVEKLGVHMPLSYSPPLRMMSPNDSAAMPVQSRDTDTSSPPTPQLSKQRDLIAWAKSTFLVPPSPQITTPLRFRDPSPDLDRYIDSDISDIDLLSSVKKGRSTKNWLLAENEGGQESTDIPSSPLQNQVDSMIPRRLANRMQVFQKWSAKSASQSQSLAR